MNGLVNELRRFTVARVGLGRTGNSIPTREVLNFQLAHARARDAVHFPLDPVSLTAEIEPIGLSVLMLKTAAKDRQEYLRRPDLGRRLDAASQALLQNRRARSCDVCFVIADGLSARAVHRHAVPLLAETVKGLDSNAWTIAPVAIVLNGRVAVADEIGFALSASLAVILIGERPGLTAADSLGVYLTWSPRPGRTEAERNCISNIHNEGLSVAAASVLLRLLMESSRARRISGVDLKIRVPELTN
jgi:ethanolamine ammonia-lyase small subunit